MNWIELQGLSLNRVPNSPEHSKLRLKMHWSGVVSAKSRFLVRDSDKLAKSSSTKQTTANDLPITGMSLFERTYSVVQATLMRSGMLYLL